MMDNIIPHNYQISIEDRRKMNQHNSFVIWLTGLSGSGKSTIANRVEVELHALGVKTYLLDGDNIRRGINKDLEFDPKCRAENIRRVAEVANLFIDAGVVVVASFISPYRVNRKKVEDVVNSSNFVEVFINTSLSECERRDVKGLYKKARAGEIKNMTGISAPYEAPKNPAIEIKTEEKTIEESVKKILDYITPKLKLNHE
ncbi:MAG: adenylyl-sulfate kinase [Flavobacteriaceae bacterium]|nr:adenylyl-sulfate kinase [Flavobacteriaceae bacterium]